MGSPSSRFAMFRQPSQRYQRAKGLKVKHVLQIAIVTVVLTWVAYELNQSRKATDSQGQDRSVFRDAVQDSSLGRRALKPEGEPVKFYLETERENQTDPDDTTTKSSLEENVDGSRVEEDADDQRERDISDLDMERASDQGETSEDNVHSNDVADVHHDVGTFFEELKNEQERAEQEEVGENDKGGDTEQDGDSQSLKSEETEGRSDGDSHLPSVVDGDKKAGQTAEVTFMDAFNADSVLKHKLDKLDEGQVEDTSRAHADEKLGSATDALKEATADSGQEVAEEKNTDQNEEEVSQKEVDEEALDVSEVSTGLDTAEDNVDSQSEVEDTQVNLVTQSNEQSDVNKEKLSVESREEGKVEGKVGTQGQKQAPLQKQVGEEEKPEDNHESLSHVQKEQEQEEKKQKEELVEKKAEVNGTESNIPPELKSEGAEVDISEKNGNQHGNKESLKNVAGEVDSSTQGSEGENKSLVQSEATDDFLGTSAEDKKEEAQQNHGGVETQNGSESHLGNTEQKKDESAETIQVEAGSKGASDLSDDSNSNVEKHGQEDHSAETVNTDASTKEDSKQEEEALKDKVLKQVTDSNAAGSVESDTKVEDQSAEKSNKPAQEVTST